METRVRLADLNILIENKYGFIRSMCRDYAAAGEACDFCVSATEAEISAEGSADYDRGYLESLALYRKIAELMPDYDGFLMHGVLMEARGRGILLCAESGVGKSFHASLWKRLLGDECRIINGDKPLVRFLGGEPFAYGTPWCGKENIQENRRVRLSDICFIERSEENSAAELSAGEALIPLIKQIHITGKDRTREFGLIDRLTKYTRFFKISCNKELSAASTAYKKLWE